MNTLLLAAGPDTKQMINLGIKLLILLLVVALFYWAITKLPLPPTIRTVAIVVLVVIAALILITQFLLPLVQ